MVTCSLPIENNATGCQSQHHKLHIQDWCFFLPVKLCSLQLVFLQNILNACTTPIKHFSKHFKYALSASTCTHFSFYYGIDTTVCRPCALEGSSGWLSAHMKGIKIINWCTSLKCFNHCKYTVQADTAPVDACAFLCTLAIKKVVP